MTTLKLIVNTLYKTNIRCIFSNILTGGDVGASILQERLREDMEKMMEEFGLNEENRIEEEKPSPKCLQFCRPCPPGQSPWETLFLEFRKRVLEGKESPISK